ncbi:peptidylprolyl isomerase [Corallococcus praedator]|uniref:Peptidylprolyl isomerase n=1 Tax=Corallococcus praedator TaxID=2316724 RepID=A0ABX9QIT9_9BACT|nr:MULTISPECIES: peptidylprolyl isomerase [Corallococcus]RKH28443.1 peptidylprolyl isomerase [Corallococcus sp. CA031C]RKI07934.1 peptidylprolyl isomerase [Corallococcus praedator]
MASKKTPSEKSPGAKASGPASSTKSQGAKASASSTPAKKPAGSTSKPPEPLASPAQAPVQQLVQRLPVAPGLGHQADLPEVKAPSLENLDVRVPAGEDLTEEDLLERFHELARAKAEVRQRAEGEALAMGDDVQLDILGYANGRLIPLSTRMGYWMELAPQLMLPGFSEVIAEASVGDSVEVGLILPDDYPAEQLRGMPARFLVDVKAAREVRMPDTESDAFLQQLGRGATHEEVMGSIVEEMEGEMADLLWVDARNLVLDTVVSRTEVQVPKALVDEEIRRRWLQMEGETLAQKFFSLEEQQEALDGWLHHPGIREDVERRLKIALVLRAIAQRDKLQLTPQVALELLKESSEPFGISEAQLRESMIDPAASAQMMDVAWHLLAVEHVMTLAKVTFEGADAGLAQG